MNSTQINPGIHTSVLGTSVSGRPLGAARASGGLRPGHPVEPALLLPRVHLLVLVLQAPLLPLDHRHPQLLRDEHGLRAEQALQALRAAAGRPPGSQQGTASQAAAGDKNPI